MAQAPQYFGYAPNPQQRPTSPKSKEARHRFTWELLLIPLVVFAVLYLVKGAEPSFSFEDIMNLLDVQNRDRYVRLFTLGCICVAIAAITRILSSNKKRRR
jgi:hypothetical protein